jgi:hypothetical protein
MMATPTAALVATIPCAIATVVVACLINPPNGVKCGERERERETFTDVGGCNAHFVHKVSTPFIYRRLVILAHGSISKQVDRARDR